MPIVTALVAGQVVALAWLQMFGPSSPLLKLLGGTLRAGTPHEVATEVSLNTAHGVERVVRDAFRRAKGGDFQQPYAQSALRLREAPRTSG